ncbi:MAG: hypothetical protein LBM61_07455 [Prevotellaceae bacterium]|nr:hypothetical protein [Prevotellaceae bacterium]
MKRLFKKIKAHIYFAGADYQLFVAIRTAKKVSKQCEGKRYYVVPNSRHKLVIRNWDQLRLMKKKKLFSFHCTEANFIRECFYFTGCTKAVREKKRKMWLNYVAYVKRLSV